MKSIRFLIVILGINVRPVFCSGMINEMRKRYERGILDISHDKVMKLVKNGDENLNIPIFDPFKIDTYDVDIHGYNLAIVGKLRNIIVRGLSHVANINYNYNFWKWTITLTLTFPKLSMIGEYNFETIQIGDYSQSALGNCSLTLNYTVVEIKLKHTLVSLHMKQIEIKKISKIEIFAEGMQENKRTSLIISKSDDTEEIALAFGERFHITNIIIDLFSKNLNAILDNHSLMQILRALQ